MYGNGSGRLALAQSITARENPLTARVWVNRVWKQHFGAGLVRTPSDFGLRAEPPSHPELLDWLADQFMKNGWSNKQLHRWIVMSRVYQQSSAPDLPVDYLQHANQVDPENRWLWRYTPRRLSFEMMRDTWLSIAGELDPTFGGRAGELFSGPNRPQRRTLYASIDRQFVPGVLRMFDYANPDMHAPQRSETTVPQQALFSLNHPFIADRAKALIRRLDALPNLTDTSARIDWLFQTVLQRNPTQVESAALTQFLNTPEETAPSIAETAKAWSYGFGEFLVESDPPLKSFHALPFFNGNSWQGSTSFPDATLGWVRLTSDGGHPGNDQQHAAVRRWTSPIQGSVHLRSIMEHQEAVGDGVRCTILSSRHGVLATEVVHNKKWDFERDSITVEPGDTLDFVTDIYQVLNTDQYLWQLDISVKNDNKFTRWNSQQDFHGPPSSLLNRWEEAAQILLISNELLFVE
jgi:plastocyanin